MNKMNERARRIPDEPFTDTKLATVSVRPQRLAFLVNSHASKEELLKYITYNSSIWGGKSNFFFPVYNSVLSESWWDALVRYDPDKIIFCDTVDDQLATTISGQIQPFRLWQWSDSVMENLQNDGFDVIGSVPIQHILQHLYEQKRPIQQSSICIPKCAKDAL